MRKHFKWIVAFAALILIAHAGPGAPPPAFVAPVDGADSWKGRNVTWWMADNANNGDAGFYKVKMQLGWQTTDPFDHSVCYDPFYANRASPAGDQQTDFTDGVGQCHSAMGAHWWYPQRGQFLQCWVAKSVLWNIKIDSCGQQTPNGFPNADPRFQSAWGMRYRICTGIPNTPFEICSATFKSQIVIIGSTATVWNSATDQ